jgi:hypothetical protein
MLSIQRKGPTTARSIQVGGKQALIPFSLPARGWSLSTKGYLIYTSRRKGVPIKRGSRAHRVVMAMLAGRPLSEDEHVHHQDFDKLNCLPANLILMPCCFNPTSARRDPYTGEYMTSLAFERRYGQAVAMAGAPSWVTSDSFVGAA